MSHVITGRLCGTICPNVEEPLANATVRVYRPDEEGDALIELVEASPKETARILSDDAVAAKDDRELLRTETDAEGRFEFVFDAEAADDDTTIVDEDAVAEYEGTPLELDVRLETVPGETVPDPDPIQLAVTHFAPHWRLEREAGTGAGFEYCFSRTFWCSVREAFGAWVVCGRAWDCEEETGRAGLTVRARDADIIQHEVLGSATTDADGHFRIYFARSDFERTPPPFGSIELFGGPDLYFEVDDTQGNALLREDTSRGRQSDREDAGVCTTVELCVDLPPDPGDGEEADPIPQFTHVGHYHVRRDIDANGYAQAGDPYAFTGVLPLEGVLPHGDANTPMEYRFLIEDLDAGTTRPIDASAIESTQIGTLQYWDQTSSGTWRLRNEPYYVNNSSASNNVQVGSNGWIEVPRESDQGQPGGPAGNGAFARNKSFLIKFDSETVVDEFYDLTSPSVHQAGDALDPGDRSTEHAFAITFESREVGNPSTVRRDTLSRIVISNTSYEQRRHPTWAPDEPTHPGVVMLDVEEFMNAGNGCIDISDAVTAAVTAYNPHIDDVRVWIDGPGTGSAHSTQLSPTNDEVATTHAFNLSSLQPCAYILKLRVSYRLTTGRSRVDADHDDIGFCVTDDS